MEKKESEGQETTHTTRGKQPPTIICSQRMSKDVNKISNTLCKIKFGSSVSSEIKQLVSILKIYFVKKRT